MILNKSNVLFVRSYSYYINFYARLRETPRTFPFVHTAYSLPQHCVPRALEQYLERPAEDVGAAMPAPGQANERDAAVHCAPSRRSLHRAPDFWPRRYLQGERTHDATDICSVEWHGSSLRAVQVRREDEDGEEAVLGFAGTGTGTEG